MLHPQAKVEIKFPPGGEIRELGIAALSGTIAKVKVSNGRSREGAAEMSANDMPQDIGIYSG